MMRYEALLQATREYLDKNRTGKFSVMRAGVEGAMEWILARAAELSAQRTPGPCDVAGCPYCSDRIDLSAQESKPVDRFRVVLAEAKRIEPFGQGGESNDYINGWKDVLEFIARAYEDKNYKLAATSVSAQDASPKDVEPDRMSTPTKHGDVFWFVELMNQLGNGDGWFMLPKEGVGGWLTHDPNKAQRYTEVEARSICAALNYFRAPHSWSKWKATDHLFLDPITTALEPPHD